MLQLNTDLFAVLVLLAKRRRLAIRLIALVLVLVFIVQPRHVTQSSDIQLLSGKLLRDLLSVPKASQRILRSTVPLHSPQYGRFD